jgi:type VI secretion system protein ImpE
MTTAGDALLAGDVAGALAAATAAVKAKPTDADARWLMAEMLLLTGDPERADKMLDAAALHEPNPAVLEFRKLLRADVLRGQVLREGRAPKFQGDDATPAQQAALRARMLLRLGDTAGATEAATEVESLRARAPGHLEDHDGNAVSFDDLRDADDVWAAEIEVLTTAGDHILVPVERIREARIDQGLLPNNVMPFEEDFLKGRLHGIATGEMQAMEAAGRTLFDFPDAPWEFQLDMARQVWDESRHAEIFSKLLEYVGSYIGEFAESEILWSCTQVDDPACRVAGINRGLEGLACDVFEQIIRMGQKMGDPIIERAVDYVLADEITHVRMGSKWMRKLTEGDPERLQRAQQFQDNIDALFNFEGFRTSKEEAPQVPLMLGSQQIDFDATLTISRETRLLAGFTDEEIDRLMKAAARSSAY